MDNDGTIFFFQMLCSKNGDNQKWKLVNWAVFQLYQQN